MIALIMMLSMAMTPVAYAQGTYTPTGVPASLGISLSDVKEARDLLKDYYDYKGSVLKAIDELRDENPELNEIFEDNGITRKITEEVIETLLNTADPESVSDLDEVIIALDDLKSNYQYLIDNLDNSFEESYDFNADGTSRFATYIYYLAKFMQDKKIMILDENTEANNRLRFSFADDYNDSTQITTNVDGDSKSYDLDDFIGLAVSDRNGYTFDALDEKLEESLNDMLWAYLDNGQGNYSIEDIAEIVEGFNLLKTIDTTPEPPTPPNNGGGGGGGGFTPPQAQNGPRAVNDELITGINIPVTVTIDELMANDIDADTFVGLGSANNGEVSIDGDEITFVPRNNFRGRGVFRYIIADENGNEDVGLVLVELSDDFVIIEDEITPLGNGGPDQLIVVDTPGIDKAKIPFKGSYINGYPDGTFRPNDFISRAEVVAILVRILEIDTSEAGESLFSDVSEEDWYYDEIQAIAKNDIISGYPDGTFRPKEPITHAEVATILSNYWGSKRIFVPMTSVGLLDIEDHWARYYIRRMFNAGVSVRFGDGTFRPDEKTTRGEIAIMMNQLIGRETRLTLNNKFMDVDDTIWGSGAIEAAADPIE